MNDTIAELTALEAKATPGRWEVGPGYWNVKQCGEERDSERQAANAALTVAMRNALPELLDEIKALTDARNDLAESYEQRTKERNAALARAEKAEAELERALAERQWLAEELALRSSRPENRDRATRSWLETAKRKGGGE